jgi:CelD/BcsL family acetyltransferase involved in cellulose biosynthesis
LQAACDRYFAPFFGVETKESNVQAYMKIPATWDEYLSGLKKSRRESIKRNFKLIDAIKATKGVMLAAEFATEETLDKFLNEFMQMHQSHWQKLGKLGHFGDWPRSEKFHRELAATLLRYKRLRLVRVKIGEESLAYTYNYLFGTTYHGLLTARSSLREYVHLSVGDVVLAKEVKVACNDHAQYFDLLMGKYEHKISQGAKYYPVRNLFICDRRPTAQLRIRVFRMLVKLLNIAYYRIWFCRLAPRLPVKRKPLWEIWIRTKGLV